MKMRVKWFVSFVFAFFLVMGLGQENVHAYLDGYDGASDSWYADEGVTNSTNPTYSFTSTDGETISTDSTGYDATVLVMGNTNCSITNGVLRTISSSDWVDASNIRVIFVDILGHTQDEVAAFKESTGCDSMYYCYDTGTTASSAYSTYWKRAISKGYTYPLVVLIDGENVIQSVTTMGPTQSEILAKIVQFAEVQTDAETFDNTTVEVAITGTEDYDAAQEMLELLNEQRAELGLSELVMDEELTEIAMQRAAETAVFYSHTRPDGTKHTALCSTCVGENIAGQLDTAEEAMQAWQLDSYSSSGSNYSNIISSTADSVGIGCFVDADGNRYWVQYYGSESGTALAKTGTEQVTYNVDVLPFLLSLTTGLENTLELEDTEYVTSMNVSNTSTGFCDFVSPLDSSNFIYSSSDSSVASVDSVGNVTVKSGGNVTLKAVLKADTSVYVSQEITVKEYADTKVNITISGTENYSYAQEILTLVNETRTSLGLSELTLDESLTEAAMQRAAEIAIYYSHTRPDGTSCFTVSTRGSARAENIAAGYTSPSAVMNGWLNSSGHYANITSENMTSIGIGCFRDSEGVWYWVQYFDNATPIEETGTGSTEVTREVSVLKELLDLYTRSSYTTTTSAIGTYISMPVYNLNAGWNYSIPQLDASNFTFSSSNTAVATVDANGQVTIQGAGTAVITASLTADPNYYISFTVTVNKLSQTVSVSTKGSSSLIVGETTTWKAKGSDGGTITYTSSDSSVATVDSTGKVTAKGAGTAYIYATAGETDSCNASSKTLIATITVSEINLATCSVSYINNTMYGLKVVWGKVTGASGYYIYIRNDDGTYNSTPTASVEGGDTTEWTDTRDLTGGKDYTYKVAAYYESSNGTVIVGSTGTTKTCKYLKWGVVESVTNVSSGLKVTWTKVTGANGYYIFRKAAGESDYTQVATVSGTGVVSWTDTSSLTSGKNYTYKVSAIFTNSKGQVTKGGALTTKTTKYLTAGKISSLTNTSTGITVKWSKVSGASGYYVYRKASSDSSYTLVKTITSVGTVSYTDTAVKSRNGTTYTYYVIPYYKNSSGAVTEGAYSATKKTVRLTGVSISSLKNSSSKKMTVKWAKNSKATGYEIQYSTSSSFASGVKTVTVSSTSTVSKVISSLTKGKTYYVRVRAYKTVSGTKYYSEWSTKKSVKISK